MHGIGGEVGVYCSGMGWTQKSNLVAYDKSQAFTDGHLEKYMCLAPDGSLPPSRICTGQRSGYDLCPSTEFTRNTLVEEMKKIRSSGVAYIQMMDQNHGGTPYMCYSHDHGHPAVPGRWESEAANRLYEQVLRDNPGLVLGCESAAAEPFIPKLPFSDNRCGLNFNGGQYRLAYSFLAGDFLTVVINDEGVILWAWGQRDFSPAYRPDREASLTLIKRLTEWRKACPEHLQFGRTQHPLPFACGQSQIFTNTGPVDVPDVVSTSYKHKNKTIHFLVNWRNTEAKVRSTALMGKKYSFHPDGERISCLDGSIVLPPLSIIAVY